MFCLVAAQYNNINKNRLAVIHAIFHVAFHLTTFEKKQNNKKHRKWFRYRNEHYLRIIPTLCILIGKIIGTFFNKSANFVFNFICLDIGQFLSRVTIWISVSKSHFSMRKKLQVVILPRFKFKAIDFNHKNSFDLNLFRAESTLAAVN